MIRRLLVFAMSLMMVITATGTIVNADSEVKEPSIDQSARDVQFKLVVRSSSQATWESFEELNQEQWVKAWAKKSEIKPQITEDGTVEQSMAWSDIELHVTSSNGEERFGLGAGSIVVDLDSGRQWKLNHSAWKLLQNRVVELRSQHYGELLSWQEAQIKVPRKGVIQVTDLETGLSFRVQRRAGSQHADVQPMTKADTAIMKQIYNGAWSWKRRAIIVSTSDNERLAASMHGMPHGGDGIPGNGFSGHFCIHFLGSTTHKSDSMDTAHQLMVYKAAGKLATYMDAASPDELAAALLEGVSQHDSSIVAIAGQGLIADKRDTTIRKLETITSIKLDKKQEIVSRSAASLEERVALTALVSRKGRKSSRETFVFTLARVSVELPWRITDIRLNR